MTKLQVDGQLMGRRHDGDNGEVTGEIVRVTESSERSGPTEESFVLVDLTDEPRGRYVSWINYFDVEYAVDHDPDGWEIVEPPEQFSKELDWQPYGWPEAEPVPTVGDEFIAAASQ